MSQLSSQWIDIFAAGDHGDKGNFSAQDLDGIVANFDPTFHEPPLVIGHPKHDTPAFGWVKSLRREGNKLQMQVKDTVSPKFEEAVRNRQFPKRSVSLYKTAKGWMLRHVGFLGGQIPEIKGLADINFSAEEDTKSVSIDFEESGMANEVNEQSIVDKLFAKFAETFGSKKGGDPAPAASFSEAQVRELVSTAVKEAVTPLQTKLDATEAKFSESAKAAASADVKTRVANAIAKLKAAGSWVPAFDKLGVPVLFEELAKTTDVVEFGEADKDGNREKKAPLDLMVEFMEQHKKIVPSSAVYDGQRPGRVASLPGNINPGGFAVSETSVRFDEAIQQRMKADKIEYFEASLLVAKEQPELAAPGGASAGAA